MPLNFRNELDTSGHGWISRGFEDLVFEIERKPDIVHFDVLIVGSGYGGTMAAMTFAECVTPSPGDGTERPVRVGLLERGNEYLPGQFPSTPSELPAHIRISRHKEGLFDVRPGPEVNALVANGLGGGSLINAGVMEKPDPSVFDDRWPEDLRHGGDDDGPDTKPHELDPFFDKARTLLGAARAENGSTASLRRNTIELAGANDGFTPLKYTRLKQLAENAGFEFRPAAVTVAFEADTVNSGGVRLNPCIHCGECATGCNFGAKDSLDSNLLVRAFNAGAAIFTGATVLRVKRDGPDWIAETVYTRGKLRARHNGVVRIRASKIILAAGTLGSTEILLRSRSDTLKFSNLLGHRCSTNGDTIITDYAGDHPVNAIANETVRPSNRRVGPTITGVVDLRNGKMTAEDPEPAGLVIEEMAVPSGMKRVFEEIFASANTLHSLIDKDRSFHVHDLPADDIYSVRPERLKNTALYAVMGADSASGRIELEHYSGEEHDGTAHIRWPGLPEQALFERQVDAVKALTKTSGGRVIPNPAWKLLPSEIDALMDGERGPVVTVHPLGGCPMADNAIAGVVDNCGRVYRRYYPTRKTSERKGRNTHEGLVVLDGSIIPTALGINPALTISAVALRASRKLAQEWFRPADIVARPHENAQIPPAHAGDVDSPLHRPEFRDRPVLDRESNPSPTEIRITERLGGRVRLKTKHGGYVDYAMDLTLRFKPKVLTELTDPKRHPSVELDTERREPMTDSRIRIMDYDKWQKLKSVSQSKLMLEQALDEAALFSAPLTGKLTMFEREPSHPFWRALRGSWAWLRNRGVRDIWQGYKDRPRGPGVLARLRDPVKTWRDLRSWLGRARLWARDTWSIASHAGEVRLEEYRLNIGDDEVGGDFGLTGSMQIHGLKRFTYNRRANPWRQLMQVRLTQYPGQPSRPMQWLFRVLRPDLRPTLELDQDFLANIDTPLYQVTTQDNAVHAMAEFGSYIAWFLRMLVGIHLWTFRLPDKENRVLSRHLLPGRLRGLPPPEVKELYVGKYVPDYEESDEAVPVYVRLTRYARPKSTRPPLVLIHGYSATGTTYAHPSVEPNFASYFYDARRDRDVWIVDLRTSAGLPTATRGWSFEQVAFCDIPAALCYIEQQTGRKLDVVCHCMGAAMFSMSILDDGKSSVGIEYLEERRKLPEIINKVVLSQIGPLIVFSPANRLRALIARFLTELLPDSYTFNPGPDPSLGQQLLDRALASVPYPEHEFDVENPGPLRFWRRTPWTQTRHRMDALYGRAFNVDQIRDEPLRHIDDFFGPMSIRTVSQTIHFANLGLITNRRGRNTFVSLSNLTDYWKFPTLGIHGDENGLSSIATQDRIGKILGTAEVLYRSETIPNAGHQDCLIGRSRKRVMKEIADFLDELPETTRMLAKAWRDSIADFNSPFDDEDRPVAVPWIGPLVTQHFTDVADSTMAAKHRELFTVRVGSTPYHKSPACIVMLPVQLKQGQVRDRHGEKFDESTVNRRMWIYRSAEFSREGWDAFLVPPALASGQILVLVIYAECAKLVGVSHENGKIAGADGKVGSSETTSAVYGSADDIDEHLVCHEYFHRPDESSPNLRTEAGAWESATGDAIDTEVWNNVAEEVWKRLDEQVSAGSSFADRVSASNCSLTHGVVTLNAPSAAERSHDLAFALGSCQYQTSFLDGQPGFNSYHRLLERLQTTHAQAGQTDDADTPPPIMPDCLVLTGDQVYVDATAGLLDPSFKDDNRYDKPYVRWLRNHSVRDVVRQLPSFMMLDDHEIEDNWEPLSAEPVETNQRKLAAGRAAYLKYQFGRLHDVIYTALGCQDLPPQADSASHDLEPGATGHPVQDDALSPAKRGLSYSFRFRGHPFFMLDTRTTREHRRASTIRVAEMFCEADWNRLVAWLQANRNTDGPKFIVSPSMILPYHRVSQRMNSGISPLESDGWDGFPASMQRLLAHIVDHELRQIVFLSGDEHYPCVATIEISNGQGKHVRAHSVHTSPTYAPFTFANGRSEDFAPHDMPYEFVRNGVDYRCHVHAGFPQSMDGFTLLRATKADNRWTVDIEFANGLYERPLELETISPTATA